MLAWISSEGFTKLQKGALRGVPQSFDHWKSEIWYIWKPTKAIDYMKMKARWTLIAIVLKMKINVWRMNFFVLQYNIRGKLRK